jgi:hypothetical protein
LRRVAAADADFGSCSAAVQARGLTAELLAALPETEIYILGRHEPGEKVPGRAEFISDHPEWTVAQSSAEYDGQVARAETRRTIERLGSGRTTWSAT